VPFSTDAWSRNARLIEAIKAMPFNAELAAGTLSPERFRLYMVNDAHYLVAFGRALAVAAAKAPDPDGIVHLAEAAKVAVVVERALHGSFFADWGISADVFATTEPSPTAHHYIASLIATAYSEPYEVVLADVLPCFWIYAEVGKHILARAAEPNSYRAWIDTYASEEFDDAVRRMIAATDRAAEGASPATLAAMHRAFTTATRLEWMFWDAAWRLERWHEPD
jgi:thiaminase/transcriptional activator TenA